MIAVRAKALVVTGVVAAMLAGCGGSGEGTTSTVGEALPPAVAAQANANCRDLVRDAKRLATGVVQRYQHSFESLTAIVTQGIPIVERIARRQQALAQSAHNPAYDQYVQLFDPLIVLLQERLSAGDAQDLTQSRRLNGLVAGLSVEQKQAARDAGLTGCNVDFRDIVTQAAFGSSQ
jgi:hypothetical protein